MQKREQLAGRFLDRFDLVFLVTIVTVGLLMLVDLNQEKGVAEALAVFVTALTAATLLLAVLAAGIGRRGLRFAWIAAGFTVVGSIIAAFLPDTISNHGGFLWLLLVLVAPVVTLRRLVQHRTVTAETVLGAVSVYLLMAVAATYLFLFLDTLGGSPGGFFGEPQPTTVFMYFSLVTITTLGYGDFAPVTVFGRSAAAWTAITGQIYLVVIVARMVAMFGGFTVRRDGPDGDGNGDGD